MSEFWEKQVEASKNTEVQRAAALVSKCSRCVNQGWCLKSSPELCEAGDLVSGKVETKSNHEKIISSGFDTFHMTYKLVTYKDSPDGCMPGELMKYLKEARELAKEGQVKVIFCDEEFEIAKFGRGNHMFQIFNDKYTIRIPVYPTSRSFFSVEFRSPYVRKYGCDEADQRMQRLLEKVAVLDKDTMHRIDMYMDLRVNPAEFFNSDFVTKSEIRHCYANKSGITSLNINKKERPIYLRMYDKLDEIGKKELCEAAYPGEKFVVRIEFQLKRRYLSTSGVTNWKSFEAMAVMMWDYLMQTYFRQVVKNGDSNLCRRPTTKIWQIVHDNFKFNQTVDSYLFEFKKRDVSIVHLLEMTAGLISSAAKAIEEKEGFKFNSSEEIKSSFLERLDILLKEKGIDLLERLEKKRGILYKPQTVLPEENNLNVK